MTEPAAIATLPVPPPELSRPGLPAFAPAPELEAWVRATIINDAGALYNREHRHLQYAEIGMLWTNVRYEKRQRHIVGEARIGQPTGSNAWSKALRERQLRQWFGQVPDFVITLDAVWFARADAAYRLAVIEHELEHCSQATDDYGAPRFGRDGRPRFAIKGHDLEIFVSQVRRYGAYNEALRELRGVLERGPTLDIGMIEALCGTCS